MPLLKYLLTSGVRDVRRTWAFTSNPPDAIPPRRGPACPMPMNPDMGQGKPPPEFSFAKPFSKPEFVLGNSGSPQPASSPGETSRLR